MILEQHDLTVSPSMLLRSDDFAFVGFDKPLRTFFISAFVQETDDYEEPEVWHGTSLEEFSSLEHLVKELEKKGFRIKGLKQEQIISMLLEAGQPSDPSLAERLGLLF